MLYSRTNPSPRYLSLLTQYRSLHTEGEKHLGLPPEKTFPGLSLPAQASKIKSLIDRTGAETILDYGSGKGAQYNPLTIRIESDREWPSIIDYWDIDEVHCYDPCYEPYSTLPQGKFDGVIATDVLEHCPEEDIPWILDEMFSYAKLFVYANVASYPAMKHLPTGENAHCTIQPTEWWREILAKISKNHPGIVWEVWVETLAHTEKGMQKLEDKLGNS